jgi:polysaccharide export outer membrane protein
MGLRHLLLAALLLTLNASVAAPLQGSLSVSSDAYRIGPGDVLTMHVYHQPDLSQPEILVTADGNAAFYGVGVLPVQGKTLADITQQLEGQLADLVKFPKVTITIARTRPGIIYLTGAVMKPGAVQLQTDVKSASAGGTVSPDLRLSSVLSAGGGVMPQSDLSQVRIQRVNGEALTLDVWQLVRQGQLADVMLSPGDTVHVPENPKAMLSDADFMTLMRASIGPGQFPVRVMGQVTKPGLINLRGVSPYLHSAVGEAGGFTVGANQKVVAIRRFTDDSHFTTLTVDPSKHDFVLRPNDIVFIAEKANYTGARFFERVNQALAPFTNVGTTLGLMRGF